MTLVLTVDPERPQGDAVERAAQIIRGGGLVAFPTETVYGLGADATNEQAIRKIFEAKGRPSDNPLIVHVADRQMLERVASEVGERAEQLIRKYWPGPLTLILTRRPEIAASVSAGLPTVAVRMPGNAVALELIARADTPIAAPSANRSGRPSPTKAEHVADDLSGGIDLILDGGPANIGIESTVLDMTAEVPMILRPGWVTREMLAEVVGPVEQARSESELRRSPGTRYRHYSPRARVILVEHGSPELIECLLRQLPEDRPAGLIGHTRVEVSRPNFHATFLQDSAADYARSIYGALREMDEHGAAVVIVEGISEQGEGAAVMDRLRRAASDITKP